MKHLLTSFLILIFIPLAFSQDEKIGLFIEENKKGEVLIFGANKTFCPLTLQLEIELNNMKSDEKLPIVKVLPPKKERIYLGTLRRLPNKKSWFESNYQYWIGDLLNINPDTNYVYRLPFELGESFLVSQGYNGDFSHQNQMAIDFEMPESTKVCAAREGIVIEIKESSNFGCKEKLCWNNGNFIRVLHDDNTMADYFHFQENGVLVEKGQKIEKGETIGLSGNTGWTSGPHLHFIVLIPTKEKYESISTKFWVDENQADFLEEGKTYKAIKK